MINYAEAKWIDHPHNPLIEPPRPQWMIADPTVLPPDKTPDGKWRMIANSVGFLNHYQSADGIAWERVGGRVCRGIRPFLFLENGVYHLFYELHVRPWLSGIAVRTSTDLHTWSDARMLIQGAWPVDGGGIKFLGNPCLVKAGDEYRLYYSTGWIWLWDCLYFEPKHIGVAPAKSIMGPYTRHGEPLLSPRKDHPLLNFGAGSVKLTPDGEGGWWVFNNGIYHDAQRKSRSAIFLWHTTDGFTWEQKADTIIGPEPGWKNAFVYAFDCVNYNGEFRLYYNARDGWFRGSERIGLATPQWGE